MTVAPPSASLPCPDLLCAVARVRVDLAALRQTLVFAFAAGAPADAFDDATANVSLGPSTWSRDVFARDLYVDELVGKCFGVQIDGKAHRSSHRYFARVLSAPPKDPADVGIRRDALAELVSSAERRRELERVVLAIVRLRGLLCAPRQPAPRVRRIEILRCSREIFELLAGSFAPESSQADAPTTLARLRDFGAAVVASDAYRRLRALLEHEDHQASLDLRVRVGADGEVRSMQIVGIHENTGNPFYLPLVRRLWVRLVLFFRGYRTTSGEVAERLLSDVFSGIEEPVALLFQVLGDAEVLLGALGFRDRAMARGLAVALPELEPPGAALEVRGLFNPLLLGSGQTPVPCDVHAGPGALVIVTGPNSGGKTRLLQSIATLQLLSQAGLFAPARVARVPTASGLFASLFEEARADQPEGHLGMELLRIRRLFDELDEGALVVLDELCSGTNPSEGEEIAALVLSLLPELGVRAFITTHLLQFAVRLSGEARASSPSAPSSLEFLQVELDEGEQSTYRFVPGVARTSLAHKTAARLGVTREELVARIAKKVRASPG
ncbi:MAG TPA: DNA mismatch repair protein [Polyangiaceae bacterium]|nr:DNA mismatch repair protein [Polyangiaceae bacterium]